MLVDDTTPDGRYADVDGKLLDHNPYEDETAEEDETDAAEDETEADTEEKTTGSSEKEVYGGFCERDNKQQLRKR